MKHKFNCFSRALNGGSTVVDTPIKGRAQVSAKCRSTVGRLSTLFLLLLMGLGFSSQAWAWNNVYLIGDPAGGWGQSDNNIIAKDNGNTSKCFHFTKDGYFAVYISYYNKQAGPSSNGSTMTTNGTGQQFSTDNSGNAAKYTGKTGVVEIHSQQDGSNADNKPWIWLTRPTIKFKYAWTTGTEWSEKTATDNEDGTYTLDEKYNSDKKGFNAGPNSNYKYANATINGNPSTGDKCQFKWTSTGYKQNGAEGDDCGTFTITRYMTISYSLNGGTGAATPSSQEVLYDGNVTLAPKPSGITKTGYDFAGWNTQADGKGSSYNAGAKIGPITYDMKLYAKWTAKTYSVTLDKNGGSANGSVTATYNGGLSNYSAAEHTTANLTGYYTATSGGDMVIDATGALISGTVSGWVTDGKWVNTNATQTLYAQWQSAATLSFNQNTTDDVTDMPDDITQDPGSVTLPETEPSRTGYTFKGWDTNKDATTGTYAAGATFDLQSNTELFAIWQENLYTVTVVSWNSSTTVQAGIATHPPVSADPKFGSNFSSWSCSDGVSVSSNKVTATEEGTITAVYAPNSDVMYVEGRFRVYTSDAQTTAVTTYGSSGDWNEKSTNIKFTYDADHARYYLNTFATPKQLSDNIGNKSQKYEPYFWINKGTSSATGSTNYKATVSSPKFTTAGESNGLAVSTSATNNPRFDMTDQSGFVTLYFDGSKIWFTVTPVQYTVTFGVKSGEEAKGTVTAKADGVAISSGDLVNRGAKVVFTSTPNEGYYNKNWYNNGTSYGSGATKTIESLTGALNITADYNEYYYTVTMATNPSAGGTVTPSEKQTLYYHTPIDISYSENTGYHFTNWQSSNANVVIANGQMSLKSGTTTTGTATVTANFEKNKYTVTVNHTGGGSTTPSGEVVNVTQVDGQDITATPEIGSYFVNWTKTAGEGSFATAATTASNNFKPTENSTITATFTKYTSSLPLSASYHAGLIRVTPDLDTHYPNTITLCYELYKGVNKQDVEFDFGSGSATNGTVTFPVAVEGTDYKLKAIVHGGSDCDATIIDEFEQGFTVEGIYTVNFAVSPADKGCSTTPASSKDNVKLNTPFAISATNGTGYHFNKWVATPAESFTFGDATDAATTATMTVETATSTITATFSPNTYSVHFNANCAEDKQQATGTMEDQSFEYDDAAKALTANAFVRLGYTFSGWSENASATEATYADKEAVQNLATESGAVVNLYAVWQLKNDCSIEVVNPGEDGTITPNAKVTNANVENVYTYTFTPATTSVTFMNWTITNAICVDGTNERSNPVKIKTYGDATIRANVKENLVSVTLKVVPNDQWGYFNVNGKNVASGTIINVGEKTTATVHGKNTNFGYQFDHFDKSDDFNDLISYDESTGEMKGKGGVGKVTLIANFGLDAATNWKLIGNWNTQGRSWEDGNEFRKHDDQVTKKIAYTSLTLNAGNYEFKIKKPDGTIMGLSKEGEMNGTYHFGWTLNNTSGDSKVFKFKPSQNSTYTFRLDYTDENNPTVTLLYQNHWFPENTTVYFNNYNEANWGRSIIRFGCDGGMAEAYDMTLVPGTANLYSYKFPQGYEYFEKYHIVNNYGWTGAKDKTNETTYGINNIGEGDYKIGRSTEHMTNANAPGCVIRIKTEHYAGDYKVEYYKYDYWSSLESSRYTVNFTAPNAEQGTLTVEQWDNNEGSARTTLSSGAKVDQSRWITITATPKEGYKFVKLTAKMSGWAQAADHYESTWKYAVQNNVEYITAEFAPVHTYTFYVKNVVSTDTRWHKNGDKAETRDVYLYYDNGKSDATKVAYWGWPGLMATPMDNNHEWYKVEMTNAYFDIKNWILNNGVGPDCPQTIHYVTDDGVPVFNGQTMVGKYYEIYQPGSKFNTYELRAASPVPDFYRVITNDNKYTSNVATVGEKVSFFATTDGAKLQKSSADGWANVANISIDKDTVWVATVGASGVTDLKHYSGNYYIRTDGADGGWNDYKKAGKNNTMTHFTKRTGETYSYYWVDNLGKEAAINVKAKIANDYNDNLAVEITNDANTNIYGNIEQLTNGSNVRFSYEPATNEFKRAILSGSAEASYLNIVAANNIYSDISCKDAFKLDENTYKTNPSACKLTDISDWVYEKIVYAKVPNTSPDITVNMYSMYNDNRSTLLNNKIIMASGTTEDTYKLRIIYDFKKNRITTAWSPSSQEITTTKTVNADIMFLQVEKGDVSQITLNKTTDPNVKSLEYLLYVLEIEDPGKGNRKEEHYRISLPFNCRVSDVFGIEGYMDKWGIQKYNGELRAEQGWYTDSPVQNFWTWLKADEIMEAGRGYSVSIDKQALSWSSIGEEVTRTVCDAQGMNCQDVTTMEDRASHRLYFPSMNPGFDLKNSTAEPEEYKELKCTKTKANRNIYDSDWRFIGTKAYNNIKTQKVIDESVAGPNYIWVLNDDETEYITVAAQEDFLYHSFGAYMLQFHGTIEWNIYTQSTPETQGIAPRKKAAEETKMANMRLDLMEEDEQQAYAFVDLNEYGTLGFDQKRDLTNLPSSKLARLATVANDVEYSGNCLPYESQIVPVTVATLHKGDYTFTAGIKPNVAVYLIDYQEKTEIDLQTTNYTVELPKGKTADRFALRFDIERTIATDLQSGKGNMNDAQTGLYKFIQNDHLYIMRDGKLYDGVGASVK